MQNLLQNRFIVFCLVLWCLPLSMDLNAEEPVFNDVVLLNSYHSTFQWTSDITDGVLQEFADSKTSRVFVEYMDSKRFQDKEYLLELKNIYAHKYRNSNIQGVIVSDNNAFDFFLEHGHEIWGDVFVSFCGINNIRAYDVDTTRFKGVDEHINIDSTLQVINELHGEIDEVIVISDSTISGLIFSKQFIDVVNLNYPNLQYNIVYCESPQQLSRKLQKICPGKKVIYLLSLYIDRGGVARDIIEEADLIRNNCSVPVYSNWDFLFGDFMVGGVVIRGSNQGREAARIMKDLLNNSYQRSWLIPAKDTLAFDYERLTKNGLADRDVFENALILNRPVNPLERFRQEVIIILLILVSLVLVIGILLRFITHKRKTEKRLIQSESRLEMALEGADEGLWDVDFSAGNIYLSQKIAVLLKYNNPNEIDFGIHNYDNVFYPADRPQIAKAYQMHSAGLSLLFHTEARVQLKSGQYVWFAIHGKIIEKDSNHNPLRMIGTITEIQSQKEFEHQLKVAKERAEESDRLKSAFLANMSHEIRTPMNAILGFTDLMMSEIKEGEEKAQYLEMIKSSGENLLNIINDIIDISKIESGQLKICTEIFDLHNLLFRVRTICLNIIRQKGKELYFHITHGLNDEKFYIKADPYRLQQILLNLLTNAIKFTSEGGIEIGYTIKDHEELVFYVNDTGTGIAPQYRSVIFERFRQVDESSIRKFGGTGLGLAITKSLVTMMKGEIWLHSELDVGSKFSFSFPCEFGHSEPVN